MLTNSHSVDLRSFIGNGISLVKTVRLSDNDFIVDYRLLSLMLLDSCEREKHSKIDSNTVKLPDRDLDTTRWQRISVSSCSLR